MAIEPSAKPTASSSSSASVTRTNERNPLASAVIATIEGTRFRRRRLVEDVAAELHDRDDAAVELESERRERDRLHVAHDLLRVLSLMRDDVDFGDATVGGSATNRTIDTSGRRQISRSTSARSISSMLVAFRSSALRD